MQDADLLAVLCPVGELDSGRLVIELKGVGVMLFLVDAGQFVAVALGLDGDSHLPAGVANNDIAGSASNAAGRR